MAAPTLEEVQRLIDQLPELDQARLLEYLAPRVTRAIAGAQAMRATESDDAARRAADAEAWRQIFRIGDALAASDLPDTQTMTAAVIAMRR